MFLCTYRLSRNSFSIICGILLFWKEINSKNALVCSKILVYCLPVCDGGGGGGDEEEEEFAGVQNYSKREMKSVPYNTIRFQMSMI